jgi:cytochrome c553
MTLSHEVFANPQKGIMIRVAKFGLALFVFTAGVAGLVSCETVSHQAAPEPVSAARGKDIYQRHCSGCHAIHGTGDAFLAVPALAGQRLEYLRRQIELFATDERHNSQMRWAFDRVSINTPQAALDVATYLSELPVPQFADGDPRHRVQGQARFAASCSVCHGTEAEGSADGSIPSLRAQHDSYLVNRLRKFASTRPMGEVGAHALDDDSIIAISAYLSSLRGVNIRSPSPLNP